MRIPIEPPFREVPNIIKVSHGRVRVLTLLVFSRSVLLRQYRDDQVHGLGGPKNIYNLRIAIIKAAR